MIKIIINDAHMQFDPETQKVSEKVVSYDVMKVEPEDESKKSLALTITHNTKTNSVDISGFCHFTSDEWKEFDRFMDSLTKTEGIKENA